jgi:hypothetical protein
MNCSLFFLLPSRWMWKVPLKHWCLSNRLTTWHHIPQPLASEPQVSLIILQKLIFHSYPCNRPWRPTGLWEVEGPTLSRQSVHRWRWGCQPYAPATLYPQEDSWYSFLLRGWVDHWAIVRLEGLGQLKKSTSSGLEPATFRLVAQSLNQLCYRVPLFFIWSMLNKVKYKQRQCDCHLPEVTEQNHDKPQSE